MMTKFNNGVKALEKAKKDDAEEGKATQQETKPEKNLS
jgi:hypothetical protein